MPITYYTKPSTYTKQNYYGSYVKPENNILSCLKILKNKILKINPTALVDNKWSDLHLAVGFKETKLIKALCNSKTINVKDAKGRTPLEIAILGGNLDIVKFLVQNGAEIAPNMYKWSAIHLAIKVGNLDIVEYLYHNTKFQEFDKYGWSLQKWAEVSGNKQIVQFFLNKDKTPLESAVESKNVSLIKILINKGAKFDIKSDIGYKMFDVAINAGDLELTEYLTNRFLSNKLTPNVLKQQTLLDKLLQIHDKKVDIVKVVKMLIEQPIDNKLGQKLLSLAASRDDLELVKTLYEKGIKLDDKDILGRTALHFAIKAESGEELIKFLIDNGNIDVNARDKSGSTLLHWAVNNHHTSAAKLLLDKGAYSFIPDYLGQKPLDLAEYYGYKDMTEILGDYSEGIL